MLSVTAEKTKEYYLQLVLQFLK